MALVLVAPPAIEPVSLEEAKLHLRVDHTDEDAYVASIISAARQDAEEHQGRAYITQTWGLVLDRFPREREIRIPRPPLQQVVSVTWLDNDDVEHTLDPASYRVDTASSPGRVILRDGYEWPSGAAEVRVRFVAGYGDAPADVPESIRQAILLIVGHLYEHRETVTTGRAATEVPWAAARLLGRKRVVRLP